MGDSYRPERGDRDRAPPLAERMTFTSGDNYRPGGRAPEFTFESSQPMPQLPSGGPANQGTRGAQRNRGGGRGRGGNTQRGGRGRGNANGPGRGNSNGAYRGVYRKAAPHERALLQQQHGGPEHTLGVAEGSNRFLNVDDMTDDEETDMVVENDASAGDGTSEGPAVREKVARLPSHNRADGDSVPRWSNPDPYTACPPPDETTGVKRDVVQLIRKAKNQDSEKAIGNNAVAANDDFISFGDNEDEDDDDLEEDDAGDQPAPKRTQPAKRMIVGSMNDIDYVAQHARNAPRNSYQPSASNKRRHGSEAQLTAEWMHDGRTNPTPWFHPKDYERLTRQPEKWLHNEILDFYEFVAPGPDDLEARTALLKRVSAAMASTNWLGAPGRIFCFGSFPAGLYLPTADMDLVYASDQLFNGGAQVVDTSQRGALKKVLYKASRRLEQARLPNAAPIVIWAAKVPIIKFTDRITNIDVDISFENLSGVQAQATFDQWKRQHPDMTFLVALVKQFLAMRGLNEVHQGGIGGFTIICLIMNYIYHTPKSSNLGQCFVGFLEYYGKHFNLATQRIQMHPPAVLWKTGVDVDGRPDKRDGLSIQDPNRPENNISGGSHNVSVIFQAFAQAHDTLTDRMRATAMDKKPGGSILACVLGGNYTQYIEHRRLLRSLAA